MKTQCVTSQIKANEQYFYLVLLMLTYNWSSLLNLWIKTKCVTIQMKAFE